MDQNPYIENEEQASEYLRMAISLLPKHKIPLSPLNYRLGYDFVAGKNEALRTALIEVVSQSTNAPTESLWGWYKRFFIQDDEALNEVRQGLVSIITNMRGDFEHSSGNLSSYTEKLNQFAGILHTKTSPEAMAAEVNKVIKETRTTEQSQRQFETQLTHIANEMESLRKELAQVKEESLIDALTGISNRKAFDTTLEQAIHAARDMKSPFCVLLADIDYFKKVNDEYGHIVGDKVLRFVASIFKQCIKGKDMAARFGGEEFAVILPQTELFGALVVAEQIRQTIASGTLKDMRSEEVYGRVTISIGAAQFNADDLPSILLHRADQALYQAKESGRNRVKMAA